jgi:hypothetical protein
MEISHNQPEKQKRIIVVQDKITGEVIKTYELKQVVTKVAVEDIDLAKERELNLEDRK